MTIHQQDPVILARAICGPYWAERVDWNKVTCRKCLKRKVAFARFAIFSTTFITVLLHPGCGGAWARGPYHPKIGQIHGKRIHKFKSTGRCIDPVTKKWARSACE